jgi:hypothetical protein
MTIRGSAGTRPGLTYPTKINNVEWMRISLIKVRLVRKTASRKPGIRRSPLRGPREPRIVGQVRTSSPSAHTAPGYSKAPASAQIRTPKPANPQVTALSPLRIQDREPSQVGIGAGPGCDAQILVWQDMAGLTTGRLPRFVRQYGAMRAGLLTAARQYVSDVAAGTYPDTDHSYA